MWITRTTALRWTIFKKSTSTRRYTCTSVTQSSGRSTSHQLPKQNSSMKSKYSYRKPLLRLAQIYKMLKNRQWWPSRSPIGYLLLKTRQQSATEYLQLKTSPRSLSSTSRLTNWITVYLPHLWLRCSIIRLFSALGLALRTLILGIHSRRIR